MLYYRKNKWFLAPDGGATGTGDGPAATSQQPQGNTNQPADPFANIDTSGLDDTSLAAFNALKGNFATLQKTATDRTAEARTHQSERDRLQAQLNHIQASVSGQQTQQPQRPATTEQRVYAQMVEAGIPADQARGQAAVMSRILESERAEITNQLGQQFAPVAQLTLAQNAEAAFNNARMLDRVGWTQVPEVAQLVWQSVQEIAASGNPVPQETVVNLARMHFMAHAEQNPAVFATLQTSQPTPPNNGMNNNPQPPSTPFRPMPPMPFGFNTGNGYPGANFSGQFPQNNGVRQTQTDANTMNAVNAVNQAWANMGLKVKTGN